MSRPVAALILSLILPLSAARSAETDPTTLESPPTPVEAVTQPSIPAHATEAMATQSSHPSLPPALTWLAQAETRLPPLAEAVGEGARHRGSALYAAGHRLGLEGYEVASAWALEHYDEAVIWLDALYDSSIILAAELVGDVKTQLDSEVATIQQQESDAPVDSAAGAQSAQVPLEAPQAEKITQSAQPPQDPS